MLLSALFEGRRKFFAIRHMILRQSPYVIGGAELISVPIEASAKKAGHRGRGITALPAAMP